MFSSENPTSFCGVGVCFIPVNEPLLLLESGEVDVGRITEIVFVGEFHAKG